MHRALPLAALILGTVACSNPVDNSPNVFYSPPDIEEVAPLDIGGDGGVSSSFPATYRFDCMEIRTLGSGSASDENPPFQITILRTSWNTDIDQARLNILFSIEALNTIDKEISFSIASGSGIVAEQCKVPDTETQSYTYPYIADRLAYAGGPAHAPGTEHDYENGCIDKVLEAAPKNSGATATVEFDFPKDETITIYAEDRSIGEPIALNCTADASPDGVALQGVSAAVTLSEDGLSMAGLIKGCLTESKAKKLCTCIIGCSFGDIETDATNPCVGCTVGASPLASQLAGLTTTERCTTLMGEPSFDVEVAFHALRMASVPPLCQ